MDLVQADITQHGTAQRFGFDWVSDDGVGVQEEVGQRAVVVDFVEVVVKGHERCDAYVYEALCGVGWISRGGYVRVLGGS